MVTVYFGKDPIHLDLEDEDIYVQHLVENYTLPHLKHMLLYLSEGMDPEGYFFVECAVKVKEMS